MPHLAITRAGVREFLQYPVGSRSLWIGSQVLSPEEIDLLRAQGYPITVFSHAVLSNSEIKSVLPTIEEHHPHEAVCVEACPQKVNPRSFDIGQAFLWQELVVGTLLTG